MTEKSNAELLADSAHLGYRVGWQRQAAAELRRIPELERQRDELLEALREMASVWATVCDAKGWDPERMGRCVVARAAITRAESTNG